MDKPTEHQCIGEEQAREFAIQQISIVKIMHTGRDDVTPGTVLAICEDCRNLIMDAMEFILPDNLGKEMEDNEPKAWRSWDNLLDLATEILDSDARQYLEGKRIVQEEGLDLNDIEEVERRGEISNMIRRAKVEQIAKKSEEEQIRIIITATDNNEFQRTNLREGSVAFYINTLIHRHEIKTILGDEAHLAEHGLAVEK